MLIATNTKQKYPGYPKENKMTPHVGLMVSNTFLESNGMDKPGTQNKMKLIQTQPQKKDKH